ncbi:MAG: fibronectin type III domain-containing protein [Clostridia bacterium]|nr:fibronectin type III domain-containing protein [Clostridia bacterium]
MKNLFKKLLVPALMVFAIVCASPMANAADYPFSYEVRDGGVVIVAGKADYVGEVVIPEKIDGVPVTIISDGAFYGAEDVTAVKLPASLKTIGNSAFEGCVTIEEIVIPDSVTSVGEGAFASCASLKSVSIGKGIDAISKGMFEGCSSLNGVILPDNIKTIDEYAFSCCDSLETIAVYPHVTKVGNYAFYDCDSLAKIALPETITVIGEGTFAECEKLASVSLHNTVTEIEALAFDGCDKMTVYYTGSMAAWAHIAIEEEGNDPLTTATIAVGHKHDNKEDVLVTPTCTEKGIGDFSCECGYAYKGEIPALGHSKVNIPEIPATCTTAGSTSGEECSRCHVILTQPQTIPAPGHAEVVDAAVEPTCTEEGKTRGSHCDACGEVFVKQEIIEKKPHNDTHEITKATTSKNGKKISTCKDCGDVRTTILYNVSQFKLADTSYAYTGKVITPTVTVKDSDGNTLKEDVDYTVTYPEGRKAIGKYTVKVTLKGDYSGSKKVSFTITPAKTAKITSKTTDKSVALTWDAVKGATGYRVYVYKTVAGKTRVKLASVTGKTTYTALKDYNGKALKAGETYKFAIQAYKKYKDGTVIYAKNGVAYTVTIPPTTPTSLKVTSTAKGKVNLSWTNVAGEDGYTVFYSTSKNGTYKKLNGTKADVAKLTASLTSGKTYYFKVRAYCAGTDGNVRSGYSPVKSVKVK